MINTKNEKLKQITFIKEFLGEELNSEINKDTSWLALCETEQLDETINESNPLPTVRFSNGLISSYSKNEPTYSLYCSLTSMYYDFNQESNIEYLLKTNW